MMVTEAVADPLDIAASHRQLAGFVDRWRFDGPNFLAQASYFTNRQRSGRHD